MKASRIHLVLGFFLLFILGACEQVGKNERWLSEREQSMPSVDSKTILIEEYTGQHCINCPSAMAELAKIERAYNGKVITVAMHAMSTGQVAAPLASEEADYYAREYRVPSSVPGIIINRTPTEEGHLYSQKRALWASYISQMMKQKASYRIQLNAEYTAKGKLNVRVIGSALSSANRYNQLGLQLWLVEDIREHQALPRGDRDDYLHHNVLRAALNGVGGITYTLGEVYQHQADIPAKVKDITNAKVVAFLFDQNTKEVYETAIVALGQGLTTEHPDKPTDEPSLNPKAKGLTFTLNGKQLEKGATITASEVDVRNKDFAELISPVVMLEPDEESMKKSFALEITKASHYEQRELGIYQVCTDQCLTVNDTEKYTKSSYTLGIKDNFIQIHYKVPVQYKSSKADYKLRVSVRENQQEVFYFYFVLSYDPSKLDTKPVPALPTPLPLETTPIAPQQPDVEHTSLYPELPKVQERTKRNVLAMDFTGQRCPSCPRVLDLLEEKKREFGSNLIVVGIHNWGYTYNASFYNQDGAHYERYNWHQISGFPTVILNNVERGTYFLPEINEHISQRPILNSVLAVRRDARQLYISFLSQYAKSVQQSHKKLQILFWVTENNVVGYQANRSDNYLHQHLMRGSLNGIWGQPYEVGTNFNLSSPLPTGVKNEHNAELIAIVLDADTKAFVDAVSVKL